MYCDMNSKRKTFIGTKLCLCAILLIATMAITVTAAADAGKSIQSFKFEEEFSIRKALAMLGSAYQKNIVPTPQVDGSLAFRGLSNVTFEDAMDAILGSNFKYEQVGNLIRVYTKDEYKKIMEDPERMEYKVFTLYYVTAAEAQNLIQPLLSGAGAIQVTSPAEKGISSGAGGSGGAGGIAGGSAGGSSGGSAGGSAMSSNGGGDTLALHDTVVIYDYPENIEAVRELLDILDVRPKQVLIEATILSALLNEGMELGVDWNLAAGVGITGVAGLKDGAITKGTPIETGGFAGTESGNGLRLGITTGDVRVFVTALESITDTTVLATPKIMTVNKQEGSVLIGRNLGYRSSTSISTGGVATEGEVKFLQTGTQLVFRPYIGNDGYIRMEIYPKDSSAELNADGVPTEQTVEMKTNVIVKDGETIIIGGLFRNVVTTTRSQVPLLGDLPYVGGLFRGTSDSNQREEVIVLLTTRIIDPPSGAEGHESAEDARRKAEGAKDELQSISRTKMAEGAYEKAAKCYVEGDIEGARQQLKISLKLRPAYLEAMRLRDRIDAEAAPTAAEIDAGMVIETADGKDDPAWSKK
ncbi:MAG TPA: type II secretion system protein GspD [Phycisphaerales bacterium]|nr:type II secretion system protein GspD [Phycisphaerales bacterium]